MKLCREKVTKDEKGDAIRTAPFRSPDYQALFMTRLKPLTLPKPVAISQPGVAPKAG